MSLYLDDGDVRLYHGDAIEQLRGLPDGCVDMVATSPPFYGLRDYGTGTWEGGDPDCDHSGRKNHDHAGEVGSRNADGNAFRNSSRYVNQGEAATTACGKCGARRVDQQIGLEETPDQWVDRLVAVFRECRRVLADHGTLWVEIGDSYASTAPGTVVDPGAMTGKHVHDGAYRRPPTPPRTKPKDLLGQPWLLAFALRADGWYLRSEIIWARPNPMPESVTDRPTKSHSTVFLLSKGPRYFFDQDAIREPYKYDGRKVLEINGTSDAAHENYANREGKTRWPAGVDGGANARSVWTIPTEPTPFAHFATWPQALVRRMILAGTSERGKCPECGLPWVRDVSVEQVRLTGSKSPVNTPNGDNWEGVTARTRKDVTTLGWSPSCACDREPVPMVVLDPFGGSGTTALVARNHGRHTILVELNADYCRLAADRLSQLSLLSEATG